MIQRSTFQLNREDGMPLSIDFLTDYAREALEIHLRQERASDMIKKVLKEILIDSAEYSTELTTDALMQIQGFKMEVMRRYDNLDHSEQNNAIRQAICELLDENPGFLIQAQKKTSLNQMIHAAQEKKKDEQNIAHNHVQER